MLVKIKIYKILLLSSLCIISFNGYSHALSNSNSNSGSKIINKKPVVIKKVSAKSAQDQHQEIALNRLILLLKKNNSFTAKFTQKNFSNRPGSVISNGIIKIHQPDKFYFHSITPDDILYVSDGTTLWQYNKDLMQVIKKPIDLNSSDLPLVILTNPDKKVLKYFNIKQINQNIFILTSLDNVSDKNSFIHQLLISFDKNGVINQFQILNTVQQQRTQINFTDVKHVKSFAKSTFDFKVPKGVDVLS